MNNVIKNILDYHFPIPRERTVVVVCDNTKSDLATEFSNELISNGVPSRLVNFSESPVSFDGLASNADISLALFASNKMWTEMGLQRYFGFINGKPTLLVNCHPVFFDFVMPLESLMRVYGSDIAADQRYLTTLHDSLPAHSRVRLTTYDGTNLTFVTRDWQVDEWTEIHTSPIEETINGRIVVDANVFFSKVISAIEITIQSGRIKSISCRDGSDPVFLNYLSQMNAARGQDDANWQLAEVGLGGNSRAQISGCIMEDEMVRVTCHFCFGDNSRYGGLNRSTWHGGTVVINNPKIELLQKNTASR